MNKLHKNDKRGFILVELLLVVVIIVVLMAISIPIFTIQLEKSREATDAANLRAAYAEVLVKVLEGEADVTSDPVVLTQKKGGWQNTSIKDIASVSTLTDQVLSAVDAGQKITVTAKADGSEPVFTVVTGN